MKCICGNEEHFLVMGEMRMGKDQLGEEVIGSLDIACAYCKGCAEAVEIWDNGEMYHADPVEPDWHGPETGVSRVKGEDGDDTRKAD